MVAQKLVKVQIGSLDGVAAGSSANYSVEQCWQTANILFNSCSSFLLIHIRILSSIPDKIPSYQAVAWGFNTC